MVNVYNSFSKCVYIFYKYAGGPRWRMHRKLITPAFHFKILEQFVDVFEADGDILIEKLSKESGNKSVDIYPYVTRCALDAICGNFFFNFWFLL